MPPITEEIHYSHSSMPLKAAEIYFRTLRTYTQSSSILSQKFAREAKVKSNRAFKGAH
jgi:hypothetical protein